MGNGGGGGGGVGNWERGEWGEAHAEPIQPGILYKCKSCCGFKISIVALGDLKLQGMSVRSSEICRRFDSGDELGQGGRGVGECWFKQHLFIHRNHKLNKQQAQGTEKL